MSTFQRIYQIVKIIPRGRIATYGLIGKIAGVNPRVVGWALHANRDLRVPCHRVVDRNGRLAPAFAFDGPREQRRRLETEGVKLKDEKHVDLAKCLFRPR